MCIKLWSHEGFLCVSVSISFFPVVSQADWDWKRPLEVTWSNTPSQARWPRADYPGLCPDRFWIISKDGDSTTSMGHLHQCSITLSVKKCFLVFGENLPEFWLVPVASSPVSGHHWNEPGSISFVPSLQVFIDMGEILLGLLFSGLSSLRCLSLFSWETCFSLLIILTALHWTLSSGESLSLVWWAAQNWTQCSSCD